MFGEPEIFQLRVQIVGQQGGDLVFETFARFIGIGQVGRIGADDERRSGDSRI